MTLLAHIMISECDGTKTAYGYLDYELTTVQTPGVSLREKTLLRTYPVHDAVVNGLGKAAPVHRITTPRRVGLQHSDVSPRTAAEHAPCHLRGITCMMTALTSCSC